MKAATKVLIGCAVVAGVAGAVALSLYSRAELADSMTAPAVLVEDTVGRAEWTIKDVKGFEASLTEADLTSICEALNREPECVSKPVLSIERLSTTEIRIYTGVLRGPLNGGGHELRLRHENGQWMVVECHHWIS